MATANSVDLEAIIVERAKQLNDSVDDEALSTAVHEMLLNVKVLHKKIQLAAKNNYFIQFLTQEQTIDHLILELKLVQLSLEVTLKQEKTELNGMVATTVNGDEDTFLYQELQKKLLTYSDAMRYATREQIKQDDREKDESPDPGRDSNLFAFACHESARLQNIRDRMRLTAAKLARTPFNTFLLPGEKKYTEFEAHALQQPTPTPTSQSRFAETLKWGDFPRTPLELQIENIKLHGSQKTKGSPVPTPRSPSPSPAGSKPPTPQPASTSPAPGPPSTSPAPSPAGSKPPTPQPTSTSPTAKSSQPSSAAQPQVQSDKKEKEDQRLQRLREQQVKNIQRRKDNNKNRTSGTVAPARNPQQPASPSPSPASPPPSPSPSPAPSAPPQQPESPSSSPASASPPPSSSPSPSASPLTFTAAMFENELLGQKEFSQNISDENDLEFDDTGSFNRATPVPSDPDNRMRKLGATRLRPFITSTSDLKEMPYRGLDARRSVEFKEKMKTFFARKVASTRPGSQDLDFSYRWLNPLSKNAEAVKVFGGAVECKNEEQLIKIYNNLWFPEVNEDTGKTEVKALLEGADEEQVAQYDSDPTLSSHVITDVDIHTNPGHSTAFPHLFYELCAIYYANTAFDPNSIEAKRSKRVVLQWKCLLALSYKAHEKYPDKQTEIRNRAAFVLNFIQQRARVVDLMVPDQRLYYFATGETDPLKYLEEVRESTDGPSKSQQSTHLPWIEQQMKRRHAQSAMTNRFYHALHALNMHTTGRDVLVPKWLVSELMINSAIILGTAVSNLYLSFGAANTHYMPMIIASTVVGAAAVAPMMNLCEPIMREKAANVIKWIRGRDTPDMSAIIEHTSKATAASLVSIRQMQSRQAGTLQDFEASRTMGAISTVAAGASAFYQYETWTKKIDLETLAKLDVPKTEKEFIQLATDVLKHGRFNVKVSQCFQGIPFTEFKTYFENYLAGKEEKAFVETDAQLYAAVQLAAADIPGVAKFCGAVHSLSDYAGNGLDTSVAQSVTEVHVKHCKVIAAAVQEFSGAFNNATNVFTDASATATQAARHLAFGEQGTWVSNIVRPANEKVTFTIDGGDPISESNMQPYVEKLRDEYKTLVALPNAFETLIENNKSDMLKVLLNETSRTTQSIYNHLAYIVTGAKEVLDASVKKSNLQAVDDQTLINTQANMKLSFISLMTTSTPVSSFVASVKLVDFLASGALRVANAFAGDKNISALLRVHSSLDWDLGRRAVDFDRVALLLYACGLESYFLNSQTPVATSALLMLAVTAFRALRTFVDKKIQTITDDRVKKMVETSSKSSISLKLEDFYKEILELNSTYATRIGLAITKVFFDLLTNRPFSTLMSMGTIGYLITRCLPEPWREYLSDNALSIFDTLLKNTVNPLLESDYLLAFLVTTLIGTSAVAAYKFREKISGYGVVDKLSKAIRFVLYGVWEVNESRYALALKKDKDGIPSALVMYYYGQNKDEPPPLATWSPTRVEERRLTRGAFDLSGVKAVLDARTHSSPEPTLFDGFGARLPAMVDPVLEEFLQHKARFYFADSLT